MRELLSWGERELDHHHIENSRREILWMASELFDCGMSDLHFNKTPITDHHVKIFKKWIQRRLNREPVQKITGKTEFYGLPLHLDSGVFIPRPETERLVDEVKTLALKEKPISILDIGTGSGCIAVALAANLNNADVTAIDISSVALKVAKINGNYHKLKNICFQKMDIIQETPKHPYDFVVSNPPYISKKDMESLMPEVVEHDPVLALTDNADGLTFYKHLAKHFHTLVDKKGYMVLETGNGDHPFEVLEIFFKYGLNAKLKKDYSGDYRVLIATSK
ncbi:MAG: peptide chain release factor N(5)-glutamine methyltransferase [Candidatus Marinimicrobia bacterium]|nr:peptide chain release factor N(5)-glutamine methyltransferase [Candidatus Neomarinimicrobiota bacterium]